MPKNYIEMNPQQQYALDQLIQRFNNVAIAYPVPSNASGQLYRDIATAYQGDLGDLAMSPKYKVDTDLSGLYPSQSKNVNIASTAPSMQLLREI